MGPVCWAGSPVLPEPGSLALSRTRSRSRRVWLVTTSANGLRPRGTHRSGVCANPSHVAAPSNPATSRAWRPVRVGCLWVVPPDLLDQPLAYAVFLAVATETNGLAGEACELTEVGAVLV